MKLAAWCLMTSDVRDPRLVLRNAVAAAIMAPSSHNSQPWRFRIRGAALELYTDHSRNLNVIDAERRQQIQSCGCALYNARIAIRAMGYTDEVTIFVVDAASPEHLATIQLGAPHVTTATERALMHAIALRRTNRRSFLPRPVPAADADEFAAAAAERGAALVRLAPEHKHALGHIVEQADEMQYADPAFREELSRWLIPIGSRRKDGIPFVEKEYGSNMPFAVMRAMRSPELGEEFGSTEEALIRGAPFVAILGTDSDDPTSWLAAGEALEAVLLHATARGLAAAFLNQALEIPGFRQRVAELAPEVGYPHMVFRLGVPSEPVHHAAPRRDLSDVLVEDPTP